ncbi:hypothetical protein KP509_30G004800 [Ceratopteris richardii]|uniref:Uncharacterized protein n=1 Tax=Ceratopteris richardii TaxID=49495 RepID=A0A8T2R0P8_CERRI|nr:hypothetical protein KP509_30G004800 [Ceratopteris richardii]
MVAVEVEVWSNNGFALCAAPDMNVCSRTSLITRFSSKKQRFFVCHVWWRRERIFGCLIILSSSGSC